MGRSTWHSATASRLAMRLLVAAILLIVVALGGLAVWAAFVTQDHARALSRAGVQTSGHLRAVQALGQIDTHTDLLEDGLNRRVLADLRSAERVLVESLHRMQVTGVAADERALALWAESQVERGLLPSVDSFLHAVRKDDEQRTDVAEERMETILEGLQLRLNEVAYDPSRALKDEVAAAAAAQRTIDRLAVVLVPLAFGCVALCGWQLAVYRTRWEATVRAGFDKSERDARTDELTGLANRRVLLEELEARGRERRDYVLVFADLNGFKHYNDSFGHAAGDALLRRLAKKLEAASNGHGLPVRLGGDEFCVLFDAPTPVGDVRSLVREALVEQGDGFGITSACGMVCFPQEAANATEALRLADMRMYAEKTGVRLSADEQISQVLLRMLDARHPGLGDHIETDLAGRCAKRLSLSPTDIRDVRRAAELHDIGKVAVPSSIITKRGRLTPDERDFIRTHSVVGERILSAAPSLQSVAALVRASHERWDGAGYPDRLAGERIPIGARIIAVSDAFSAMTRDRPYQEARPVDDALDELRRCAGTQFDPAVVEAFIAVHRGSAHEGQHGTMIAQLTP